MEVGNSWRSRSFVKSSRGPALCILNVFVIVDESACVQFCAHLLHAECENVKEEVITQLIGSE